MRNLINITLVFVFFSMLVSGQFISNPSFETEYSGVGAPEGWSTCNENSTPDRQPNEWGVYFSPSHGQNYIGMTARGKNLQEAKNEAIQTVLLKPFEKYGCYRLSIDLARCEITDGLYVSYPDPLKLYIWGGNASCEKAEKLVETGYINHLQWYTYSYLIIPDTLYTYLIFEVVVDDDARGYMLLDNIVIEEPRIERYYIRMDTTIKPDDHIILEASESVEYNWRPMEGLSCYDCRFPEISIENSTTFICTLHDSIGCLFEEVFAFNINVYVPNVFTPNNDGINDFFRIDGLQPNSLLTVFDRNGQLVYQNRNYTNNWYGEDINGHSLKEDTYWYILRIPGEAYELKGFVYIKR